MAAKEAIDEALRRAFNSVTGPSTPPRLRAAMHHGVFPGGGRLRPRLVLEVAEACGNRRPEVAEAAAAAIEFLHCASLVHDDLPCFDNAAMRRGRPTVHVEFGAEIAVLVGDALIAAAYRVLGDGAARHPQLLPSLLGAVWDGLGAVRGIIAGQAWESEQQADLRAYHRAKTAALFEAAAMTGAIAGGGDPDAWRPLGTRIGEAYQIADDILDLVASPDMLGKPVGRDVILGRPSAALELGVDGAQARLESLVHSVLDAVPESPGRTKFIGFMRPLCNRLLMDRHEPARDRVSRTEAAVPA
jgi:geranylgeranyl diphosphate synthase type II